MEKEMKRLWAAYLFANYGSAELDQFLRIAKDLQGGADPLDPQLAQGSMTWQCLQATNSQSLEAQSFDRFRQTILRAIQNHIHFTFPGCADYPQSLLVLSEIPFFLNYVGQPCWLEKEALGIVGSREPTQSSEAWCEAELAQVFSYLPLYSVSGGARGIDQLVHRLSIRMRIPTLALLPSGLAQIYPDTLSPFVGQIRQTGGALMSEYLPQTTMRKHFFQRRNRLIAGFSSACLIVEARRKSGTLITAKQALEQGKPLLIVPTHPYDSSGVGGLDLICEGATPVRDAQDLIIFLSAELRRDFDFKTGVVDKGTGHH